MFPRLEQEGRSVVEGEAAQSILEDPAFAEFESINMLPLIYDEENSRCNILVFDYERASCEVARIEKIESGRGRKHPVYRFFNSDGDYICEVRYGDAAANALQRGLWTHTRNGEQYFESITGGWIDYSHNHVLVDLFSHALVSSDSGHESALDEIRDDIARIKRMSGM